MSIPYSTYIPPSEPLPSTITPSINLDSNYSGLLETDEIYSRIYYLSTSATWSDGYVRGLNPFPIYESEAVLRSYVRDTAPTGPASSVQYNYNNSFAGSADLTFTGGFNLGTLNLNGTFTDGVANIEGTQINDLNFPYVGSSIVRKSYLDLYQQYRSVTWVSTTGMSYSSTNLVLTPLNLVGGIFVNETSSTLGNLVLPSYTNISTFLNTNTGSYPFSLVNQNASSITITTSSTVSITPSNSTLNIPSYYTMNGILNVKPTAINLIVTGDDCNVLFGSNMFESTGSFSTFGPYKITNNLLFPAPDTPTNATNASNNLNYDTAKVSLGFIIRNPSGASDDTFGDLRLSCQFVIQNISAFNITLSSSNSNTGSWVFVDDDITIAADQSAILYIYYSTGINYLSLVMKTSIA